MTRNLRSGGCIDGGFAAELVWKCGFRRCGREAVVAAIFRKVRQDQQELRGIRDLVGRLGRLGKKGQLGLQVLLVKLGLRVLRGSRVLRDSAASLKPFRVGLLRPVLGLVPGEFEFGWNRLAAWICADFFLDSAGCGIG